MLVLGGASTPFFHGSQALSFSIWNAWPGEYPFSISAIFRKSRHQRHQPRLYQHRSALCITRNMNVIIPPHPPHPSTYIALRTDVSVHEHYINIAMRCASRVTWTLSPHPTPPHPTHQRSTAYRCQRARTLHQHRSALCITRNMNVIIPPHPTPPHTPQRSTAYRCQRARTLHQHRSALCITRNMNVIIPPHPTPRNHDIRGKKCTKPRCAYGKSA